MRLIIKHLWFACYLLCSIVLSFVAHRELLFNSLNYGRHWDWTFFSYISMYVRYIQTFFYVINNNAVGSYGAIGFSDFLLKSMIVFIGKSLPSVSLTLINKATVFVGLPLLASVGMWILTKNIFRKTQIDQFTTGQLRSLG